MQMSTGETLNKEEQKMVTVFTAAIIVMTAIGSLAIIGSAW